MKAGFSKWDLIREVEKRSEIGLMMVQMTMSYLQSFARELKGKSYRIISKEEITEEMWELTKIRLQTMPENMRLMIGGLYGNNN